MLKRFVKTNILAAVLATSALSFIACNNAGHDDRGASDEDYTAYRTYVTSVRDSSDRYYSRNWSDLERDYNERKARMDAKKDKMDEKTRADYEKLEADWNDFKTRYEQRRAAEARKDTVDRLTVIRTRFMYPDASDYNYTNLAAQNVALAYQRFFDGFKGNAENYSTEDWAELDRIYKALEERREALKKDITPKDASMINTIKKQYASIMVNHRPFAESDKK